MDTVSQFQARPERSLMPSCETLEEYERLNHRDLADLSTEQLVAEERILANMLAGRIFRRRRERIVWTDGRRIVGDLGWLRDRRGRLRAELELRGGRR